MMINTTSQMLLEGKVDSNTGVPPIGSLDNDTESNEITTTEVYIHLLLLGICCVLGTLLNLLMIISISVYKKMRSPSNMFLMNIALKDLFVSLVYIPCHMNGYIKQGLTFRPGTCHFVGFVMMIGFFAGVLTHAILSINQLYYATRNYAAYHRVFSYYSTVALTIMTWALPITSVVLYYTTETMTVSFNGVYFACTVTAIDQALTIISSALWIAICYIIICFSYFQLYAKVDTRVVPMGTSPLATEAFIQATKTIALALICYSLSWLGCSVVFACDRYYAHFNETIHRFSYELLEFQVLINPLVHYIREADHRESACKVVCHLLTLQCHCYKYYKRGRYNGATTDNHITIHNVNFRMQSPGVTMSECELESTTSTVTDPPTDTKGFQTDSIFFIPGSEPRSFSRSTAYSSATDDIF